MFFCVCVISKIYGQFAPRIMPPLAGFAFVFVADSRGSRPLRGFTPGYHISPLTGALNYARLRSQLGI